jgi:hypothetical protein
MPAVGAGGDELRVWPRIPAAVKGVVLRDSDAWGHRTPRIGHPRACVLVTQHQVYLRGQRQINPYLRR